MLIEFITQSIRNRRTVGAVLPSSRRLCRALAVNTLSERNGPLRILEVGAGTGPVTAELTQRMQPGDHLDAVELNGAFCQILTQRFPGLPVHPFSILDYDAQPYDRIVSGLPLANFPADMVEAIYDKLFSLMKPDGRFIMFHYMGIRETLRHFGSAESRRNLNRILDMERRLRPVVAAEVRVPWNVPPAVVTVRHRPENTRKLLTG